MSLVEQLRALLDSTLSLGGRGLALGPESPLLGEVPELDSVGVVAVITALEERLGISVEDDEISADTFQSLGSLTDYVTAKLGLRS